MFSNSIIDSVNKNIFSDWIKVVLKLSFQLKEESFKMFYFSYSFIQFIIFQFFKKLSLFWIPSEFEFSDIKSEVYLFRYHTLKK